MLPDSDRPLHPSFATPEFGQGAKPGNHALIGPLGLRAGWGILLFFVLTAITAFLLFVALFKGTGELKKYKADEQIAKKAQIEAKAAHRPAPQIPAKLPYVLLAEAAQSGSVLAAGLALAWVEKRRFGVFGLGSHFLRSVLPGAVWGLISISVLIALLRGFDLLVFDGQLLHGQALLGYGAGWLVVFALVGLFEEFLFRGYIQFTLMRGLLGLGARISARNPQRAAFWLAALAWSLLFSATHLGNAGEDPMGIVMVFVAGILFSYALWRTGSLWWGIGFHMTWDWGQSFLYGVPDSGNLSAGRLFATHPVGHPLLSGGLAGPEGSVLVLPVLALVALVLRMHPQAEQPPVEPISLPLVRGSVGAPTIP